MNRTFGMMNRVTTGNHCRYKNFNSFITELGHQRRETARFFSSRETVGGEGGDELPRLYKRGDHVKAKVLQFGPIGASVELDGGKGRGLIVQKEIAMFRGRRNGVDVVIGETLDGFVERVRDDGKINVFLRNTSIVSRMSEVKLMIMESLEGSPDGFIPVGDKSTPEDIGRYFHGVSKRDFKTAVGSLYKEGMLVPSDYETVCVPLEKRQKVKEILSKNTPNSREGWE